MRRVLRQTLSRCSRRRHVSERHGQDAGETARPAWDSGGEGRAAPGMARPGPGACTARDARVDPTLRCVSQQLCTAHRPSAAAIAWMTAGSFSSAAARRRFPLPEEAPVKRYPSKARRKPDGEGVGRRGFRGPARGEETAGGGRIEQCLPESTAMELGPSRRFRSSAECGGGA